MFSLERGTNAAIARARNTLMSMEGGMDLLFSLISFDPTKRFSALDVMNSAFMAPLRDGNNPLDGNTNDKIYLYMSYLTRS
jgi:serine/threonine protein kinase